MQPTNQPTNQLDSCASWVFFGFSIFCSADWVLGLAFCKVKNLVPEMTHKVSIAALNPTTPTPSSYQKDYLETWSRQLQLPSVYITIK